MPAEPIRECRYCGEPKYETAEHFSVKNPRTGRLSGFCRECEKYRERNGLMARRPIHDLPTKTCNVCQVEKVRTEFYRAHWRPDAVSSRCKRCESKKVTRQHLARIRADWRVRLYRYAKGNNICRGSVHEKPNWDPAYMQELYEQQSGRCYWTGVEMSLEMGTLCSISLDRLDNAVGYLKGNVVLTTRAANFGRNAAPAHEFAEFIKKIKEVQHG